MTKTYTVSIIRFMTFTPVKCLRLLFDSKRPDNPIGQIVSSDPTVCFDDYGFIFVAGVAILIIGIILLYFFKRTK